MEEFLLKLVEQHTGLSAVLLGIGTFRAVFKPLVSAAELFVKESPSKKDDKKFEALKNSKVFKALAWILDYTASIKMPVKKK